MDEIFIENKPKRRNRTIKFFFYFLLTGFLIRLILAGCIVYGLYQFFTPLGVGAWQDVTIEKGEGVKEIAKTLEDDKLIRSAFWFEAYIWLEGKQNKFQAGQYSISPSQNINQIVDMITQGRVVVNDIWATIPEGFTLKQIKERLVAADLSVAGGIDKETIGSFKSDYSFLAEAPSAASLEGFLFPDTYKFKKEVSEKEILQKMLDNFDAKLTQKMRDDIKGQNKTVFKIITMASIIEKEGKTAGDRKIIAGIFWNRIKDKYPLESDATLSYLFNDKVLRHTTEQTKVDSPYNTYKYAGLPPGPINNPGLEAIEAAIYPAQTDYYYFLTKPETGEAVFAKTLEEHNANKAKFLK